GRGRVAVGGRPVEWGSGRPRPARGPGRPPRRHAARGGERLPRQGAPRARAARSARRGAAGALRDRHHALAGGRALGGGGRRRSRGGDGAGEPARARGPAPPPPTPRMDKPPAHPPRARARRERAPLTERLRSEPVLRLAGESRGRALLDHYLAEHRIRPVSTIDVPSVSLLLSYVSGGLGIGLVPALALAEASAGLVVRE